MTPDLLRSIGEALWGLSWQSALARELGVSDRTVRRWAAGKFAPPEGIAARLAEIAAERETRLRDIRKAMFERRRR